MAFRTLCLWEKIPHKPQAKTRSVILKFDWGSGYDIELAIEGVGKTFEGKLG